MKTMTMDDAAGRGLGLLVGAGSRGGGNRSRGGSPHGRIALQFGGEHSSHVKKGSEGDDDSSRLSLPAVASNTPLRSTSTPPQTPVSSLQALDDELDGLGSVPQSAKKGDDKLTLPHEGDEDDVVSVVTSVLQALVGKCIEACGGDGDEVQGREMLTEEETATTAQRGGSGTEEEEMRRLVVQLLDREEEPSEEERGGERLQPKQSQEQGLGIFDHRPMSYDHLPIVERKQEHEPPQHTELQVEGDDDAKTSGAKGNDEPEPPHSERPPLTAATGPLLWRASRSRSGSVNNEMDDDDDHWEGVGGIKGGIAMLINHNRNNHDQDNMDEPLMLSRVPTHHLPSTPPPVVRSSSFTSPPSSPSALALALSPVSLR